ncbi:hypothetical protein BWZ43_23345 [Heyndrickxia oleronia]|uniref:Uncharacterized protein n=1 Tax=Heyndrickxia oleronia TaxID=38875 RepID=A0A8E2LBI7_9BACI|nr:hypothetical protein BWZ43_23345 [Heyndrickxia oleronia]
MILIIKALKYIGVIAAILNILLWLILNFFNPYTNHSEFGLLIMTFLMLFLPACLAIFAFLLSKPFLLCISFLWSLPISLYLVLTPSIFEIAGVTCLLYLISYLLIGKS